jgi:glycosyltransferase involved in cell wall biosynthesis
MRLAVHYLGCAKDVGNGVAVPSRIGPLIEALASQVEAVIVVAYDPPDRPGLEDTVDFEVAGGNVSFVSLGPKGTYRGHRARSRLVSEIAHQASAGWDVLLFYLPNRRAFAVSRANAAPRTAAFIVGHSPTVIRRAPWKLLRKVVVLLAALWAERRHRAILAGSGVAIANSAELTRRYRRVAPPIRLIPVSARSERYSYRTEDRFDGHAVNLMITGRIVEEKGVFDALEAFARLRSSTLRNARLHVVGTGAGLDELLRRAQLLGVSGDVVQHGWIPAGEALFAVYREMDVLLLPSYEEGFPYAIWEALAHSVLVVCTAVGGIPHWVGHEREALFVPMKDPAAIVDAVERLAGDPVLRKRLIATGYDRARQSSVESVSREITSAITQQWTDLAPPQRG